MELSQRVGLDTIFLMCPCADDNTVKLNGGNVTEQKDRSSVPTLVDSQSDRLERGRE